MEELHRGDEAEKGSRLPLADDRRLSEQQMGRTRGQQMVSLGREDMWCPSRVAGGTTRVKCHV